VVKLENPSNQTPAEKGITESYSEEMKRHKQPSLDVVREYYHKD
jgi:hypothetical protein